MSKQNVSRYYLKGLDCANCAAKLEEALRREPGLENATINFATGTAHFDGRYLERAKAIIAELEPEVKVEAAEEKARSLPSYRDVLSEQRDDIVRILGAVLLLAIALVVDGRLQSSSFPWLAYVPYLGSYLLVGFPVIRSAARNVMKGELFDENALMTIATVGAIAIRELPEAVAVMLFYAVGEAFQEAAVSRSRRSISALVDIRPERARLMREGQHQIVSPEQVEVGDTIVVYPGERIPLDGQVVHGTAFVDTSALTGESVPRRVGEGDEVLAGMVTSGSTLTVRVTKPFAESAISRILRLVEEAAERKARTERLITRFSRYYTPIVIALAAAIAVLPPLLVSDATFSTWVYRALVLLVISCPCALVVSVPLTYFGGIGAVSRHGVLVKGATYLDALAKLDTVAFDKTGTLTKGTFRVTEVFPHNGFTHEEVLEAAARVESPSNHPIAASILDAYGYTVRSDEVEAFEELAGHGVTGRAFGREILVGNDRLLHLKGIVHPPEVCSTVGTVVHVAIDGTYAGHIMISDEIRPDAKATVSALHRLGVRRVAMLTGDDRSAAEIVGTRLGIDLIHARLLPEEKVSRLGELAAGVPEGQSLAFVGDGINDAPVLSRADVGIAMGGLGSDAAIEAADVVIMDDRPSKLPAAIEVAKNTRRIVYQNIAFALGVKTLFMLLGALGAASIWGAVFADVGVTLLTILNAMRLLRFRAMGVSEAATQTLGYESEQQVA